MNDYHFLVTEIVVPAAHISTKISKQNCWFNLYLEEDIGKHEHNNAGYH